MVEWQHQWAGLRQVGVVAESQVAHDALHVPAFWNSACQLIVMQFDPLQHTDTHTQQVCEGFLK